MANLHAIYQSWKMLLLLLFGAVFFTYFCLEKLPARSRVPAYILPFKMRVNVYTEPDTIASDPPLPAKVVIPSPEETLPLVSDDSSTQSLVNSTSTSRSSSTTTTTPAKPLVIYGATTPWDGMPWRNIFNVEHCKYSNCVTKGSNDFKGIEEAAVVVFSEPVFIRNGFPNLPWQVRQNQYWFMMTIESGVFGSHVFPADFNGRFNGSITPRRDATIYNPYGKIVNRTGEELKKTNFAEGKTKGAFAYVSNCYNGNYNRLDLMEKLAQYTDVEIFSGSCKGQKQWPHVKSNDLCPRLAAGSNRGCETEKHKHYRFYLSFENSLCFDYITEKFWDRLRSSSYFIPVVMGGLSVEDYERVAPKNSFIHVYNFSSVAALGEHLNYLINHEDAYNRYHEWRYTYTINSEINLSACKVCELANLRPSLPAINNIAEWRNNASLCRKYDVH
ncbi:4-galactosyl-N-acetylglucosaminide 3-alpha-L-fucosyltransferase FUT5-like [Watersipora subatra]|uniref:4-galactosyl-N-acetylglucosaminide 3-alpha-L-fucosyltransferase FUT5-like n=1 Tax=Watersipora subatra TaxID=2589382 RepID=UPI00355AE855